MSHSDHDHDHDHAEQTEPATGEDVEKVEKVARVLFELSHKPINAAPDWADTCDVTWREYNSDARAILAALDLPGRVEALRKEIERLQRQVDLLTAYDEAYWATQTELDRLLGTEEDDGSGAGLAAEVRLLGEQRDDARAEAERWKSLAMKLMVQAPIIMGEK